MKIGVIGDLHFKDRLGYADLVSDGRSGERALVLDQIYMGLKDCEAVVFLGDNLDSRNNSSKTLKEFVTFIERFDAEKVFILAGNHEKWADGRSAIDFLKQVKRPWKVLTNGIEAHDINGTKVSFLPFISRFELGSSDDKEAAQSLSDTLPGGDILFAHHAFTGINIRGTLSDEFNEPVLPQEVLKSKYKLTVIGHIHTSNDSDYPGFLLAGSIFCNELNEKDKSVWIVDVDANKDISVEKIPIKQRSIIKMVDPTEEEINALDCKNTIVKAEITKRDIDKGAIKQMLQKCAGYTLVERYFNKRQSNTDADVMDYSVENMLKLYAKAKKIDYALLAHGYELIKK